MPYAVVYPRSSIQRDVTVIGPYPVPVGDWLVGGIRQSVIGVGLTPMALPTVSMIDRRWISVYNNSDYTIYLGNPSVTIGDGQPLESGQPFAINLDQNVILYAVGEAALTMCDIRIMEGA
ncbi:unnamed protein product [marine sediment metagenome]|uniref:Uncharacterized protein n=1 Tax=marine sediment metagenome TaxID=412755 RepID=X1FPG0_9ZZZZ